MVADDMLHVFGFNFTKLDIDKSRSFAISTRDHRAVHEAAQAVRGRRHPPALHAGAIEPGGQSRDRAGDADRVHQGRAAGAGDLRREGPRPGDGQAAEGARGERRERPRASAASRATDGGIDARKLASMRLHVRAIIRDGTRAFVGSQSLRKDELESRREVGLMVNNPTVARKLLQVFESDWADSGKSSKAKDAA